MRRFGDFEAADLVSQTALATVWAARKPPGTANQYAIKVLDPHESLPDPERFERQRNRFLGGAAVQERLTRAGALFWAPVYQQGKSDQGAFYVTDRFEQSLQYLIDGQVRLNGETLGTIVASISSGLLELRQGCNRPHGNLKPTNILVRRRHASALANLALTDPLADESIQPHHGAADLRRLGELIYVLAAMRPAPETPGWQIPAEEKWSHLGSGWRKWKSLCNQLLRAPSQSDGIRLEGVLRMAARLQRAPRVARRVTIAVGCVILCAIAGGVYERMTRKADPDMWWTVCAENISWVENLATSTDDIPLQNWGPIKDVVVLANKRTIDLKSTWPFPRFSETPVETDITAIGLRNNIDKLRGYLTPGSPTQEDGWDLLWRIKITADDLDTFSPNSPLANALNTIVSAVRPPNVGDIEKIRDRAVNDYVTARDEIEAIGKENRKIGNNVRCIVNNREALRALCDNITALKQSMDKLNNSGGVFSLIADRIKDEFSKHASDIAVTVSGNPLTIQADVLITRTGDLRNFTNIVNNLKSLVIKPEDAKRLNEDWDGLLKAAPDFNQLTDKIMAYAETDGEWLIKQQAKTFNDSDALKEHWKSLLDGFKGQMVRNTSNASLFEHRIKIENDHKGLVRIDNKRKQIADILLKDLDPAWSQFRSLYQDAIESVLKDVLKKKTVVDSFDSNTITELNNLEAATEYLRQVITSHKTLRDRFENAYLLALDPETRTAADSFRKTREEFRNSATLQGLSAFVSAVDNKVTELEERVKLQETIQTMADRDAVEKHATSSKDIDCRYAAWLRLGKLESKWPANEIEWGKEIKIYAALSDLLTAVGKNNSDILTHFNEEGNRRIRIYHQNRAVALNNEWTTLNTIVKTHGTVVEDHGTLIRGSIYPGLSEFLNIFKNKIDQYRATAKNETWDQLDRKELSIKLDESMKDSNSILPAAKRLSDFLQSKYWTDTDNYDRDLFMHDEVKLKDPSILQWPQQLVDNYDLQYKRLPDNFWSKVKANLTKLKTAIDNETHGQNVDDAYALAEQELTNYINKIDNNNQDRNPFELIVKNEGGLAGKRDALDKRIVNIRDMLRPDFCKNLKLEGEKVVFDIPELSQFEPILFAGPDETLPWVQKKDMWLSLGPRAWNLIKEQDGTKELKSQIDQWQLSTGNLIPEDKEKDRWISMKDINTQTLQEMFFWKFTGNEKELRWPKYIRSKNDPSVILRYIPDKTKPFYIAVREITAQQYITFLNSLAQKPEIITLSNTFKIWTVDVMDPWFDYNSDIRGYPKPIDYGISFQCENPEIPITYITYRGALEYAQWISGQTATSLPTGSQHKFAAMANGPLCPWKTDAETAYSALLRGKSWEQQADNYNNANTQSANEGTLFRIAPGKKVIGIPLGVVRPDDKEFTNLSTISPKIQLNVVDYFDVDTKNVWPSETGLHANQWGLHDMLGNVWEWCTDESATNTGICGYSCLTPNSYVEEQGQYYCLDENSRSPKGYTHTLKPDCDIGFRVIMNLPGK